MKKHKLKLFGQIVVLSATMMMVSSCQKEYLPEEAMEHIIGVERHITASAILPQSADKAYLDYTDGRKVKWELTDSLNINGTNIVLSKLNVAPVSVLINNVESIKIRWLSF